MPDPQNRSLEAPPPPEEVGSERRWAWISLGLIALVLAWMVVVVRTYNGRPGPAAAAPADRGPLPAEVRARAQALLEPHLDHAEFTERLEQDGRIREFHVKGRPKAMLAKEFKAGFTPMVVDRLMPLLRPYGDVISFEIDNLDYRDVRLRDIPPSGGR